MNQRQFYKCQAWAQARAAYIAYRTALDGGMCEVCHQDLGKIVHHKIWLNDDNCNDPDIALAFSNFKYECQDCHNKEKDPQQAIPGRVIYGPDGEILPRN